MLSEVDDSEHHHLFLNQIHEIKVFLIFISHFELDGVGTIPWIHNMMVFFY